MGLRLKLAFVLALQVAAPALARAAAPQGEFIETASAKLWVVDTGGSGTPVILLHSNTGTVARWAQQIPALAAAGYRVVAFDREGWGKSVTKPGARPASVAADLDAIADRLRLGSFDLVGESGGGYVAIDYASWRPQRVRALVIAASGGGLSDPESKAFRKRAAIPGFDQMPPEVRELSPSYRGLHPAGVARWLAIETTTPHGGPSETILRTPNSLAKIESIAAPTLVIAGDVDLTTPSGAVRMWAQHLRNYEFALIPEAGHAVSWEQPDAFNRLTIAFLKRHPM